MEKVYENIRKPMRQLRFVTAAAIDSIPSGRGATIQLEEGGEVALFNINGKYFAIENHCPHRGVPIADSRTYDNIVECDFHGWRFDLTNGNCLTTENCTLETYDVKIEDGMIKILV